MERQRRLSAAIKIQAWWRAQGDRNQFLIKRRACVTLQQPLEGKKAC